MPQIGFLFSSCCAIHPNHEIRTMIPPTRQLAGVFVRTENPNHHLWNNPGTWFLHYTAHPTPFTKNRIRRSLRTRDLKAARGRRDRFFETLTDGSHRSAALTRRQVAA